MSFSQKRFYFQAISKYEELVTADKIPETSLYCRLGHLHLLVEDYNKGKLVW